MSTGPPDTLSADLELALELADAADSVTREHFAHVRDLVVDTKPDLTPVTEADRETERVMRDHLGRSRPEDGIVGEEHGATGSSSRRWVLDPIDGTKNFIRGVPIWATLVALEVDGSPQLGVVSAPALCARWWAVRGGGAFLEGERISVSEVATIGEAHLAYDSVPEMEEVGFGDAFLALLPRCWRTRGVGDFWAHVLVAQGAMDAAVGPEVNRWDWSAPSLIVEEAGGRVTTLEGAALDDRCSILATNGVLHDEILAALEGGGSRG